MSDFNTPISEEAYALATHDATYDAMHGAMRDDMHDAIRAGQRQADDDLVSLASRDFVEATTNPARAAALLIIPHALLLRDDVHYAIFNAAMQHSLWMARDYIDAVVSAASAVRTTTGTLPDHIAARLEGQRQTLASMAAATGDDEHRIKATYEAKIGIKDTVLHQQSEAYRTAWDETDAAQGTEGKTDD